jgi:hypothetical protein
MMPRLNGQRVRLEDLPVMGDAMQALMAFGTVAIEITHRRESIMARAVRPGEMYETAIERGCRLWKRPMFMMKDNDPQITWDAKAMAARPFRALK